ncbi:MAG TPA: Ig-like domain-containing protein [Verrucomicrobiae bacterium]|nr:Ig-like domain-containing protein [Verrucomicrobiae bacterium]
MPRLVHRCAVFFALAWIGVAAFCAGTRAALVLDDPLQGSTTATARSGGAFVAGGWQVTGQTDTIYWHVPTVTNGAAEFDVRGLYPNECRAGMEDKVELWHMYDYTFGNADINYNGGYRDCPFKHFIRKTGCLDTVRVNSMEIVWQIQPNYVEPDTTVLSWDPATTYRSREEWGPDGAGNSVLRLYRNGTLILTTSVPGSWNPGGHSVRIAASPRRAPDFGAPIGAVFSNVKVWNLSIGGASAPTITQPVSNATVNTTVVFVEWNGGPHSRYQVRVTQVNDPDSSIAWDSGDVASDRNFAWTGPLPDLTTYHLFARLGDASGWGPWSANGRTFRVDTTSASAGANLVRVNGKSLRDNTGPFLGLGASYFQALRRAKFDRPRLTNDLAVLAARGFNYVRILSMVNWDGLEIAPVSFVNSAGNAVTGWTDYAQQFRDMLDIIAAHGLRAEVTVFADAQYVMPSKTTRRAHLDLILAGIAGREHKVVHLEVANEAWQNGFPGSTGISDLREFAQYLADRTSVPVAITSNDDLSDAGITSLNVGSAADLATVHFSRDVGTIEGGWLPVRECYRAGNLPGVPPVTSNEPIGPGSSVSSENDPIKLCSAAIFAYIANLPAYVYHTRAGVSGWANCCPPSGAEARFENMAGINAYRFLRGILPGDLASWVRNDGLEASAPFTVFCNGQPNQYWPTIASPTSGCDRNIGSAKGREFVCFPMGILGGGVTLQARRAMKFQVFNPLTGAVVSNVTMNVGNSITLPQGPGAYVLKGSFVDVNTPLVPRGALWKYLNNGSDQGTAWRAAAFNDSAWASGPAKLGFGDPDIATIVNGGPSTNRFITTYFRRAFPVGNASAIASMSLRVARDDGAIVYLNGAEVFRNNMPAGAVTYATYASIPVNGADETNFYAINLSPGLLVSGTNVLAVEIHQANATSSDLGFDLEFTGTGNLPPIVNISSPGNNATLAAPANVALNALALDSDGVISKVEFFVGGLKVGEDTTAPFSLQLSNLPVGSYALTAAATDDAGATTTSATNIISVKELLIAAGSDWKFLDNGSNQGTAWSAPAFNDSLWASGPAPLGFGDGDEATVINGGPSANRFVTTYFRRAFPVAAAAAFANLHLRVLRDDGAIAFLNGVEVFRSNMPLGAVNYLTYTPTVAAGADETTTFYTTNVSPALLVNGTNVLAVEIHQFNATSTDLSFDLELTADPAPPRLSVSLDGGSVLLSWPVWAGGLRLQSAAQLTPVTTWSNLLTSVTTTNGQNRVTIAASAAHQFFRLTNP